MDTIFAVASAPGKCGVTIVRISGPLVSNALDAFGVSLPEPRVATVSTLKSRDGSRIDRCVILYFVGPASFTGEDVVELHLHGSLAILDVVLQMLEQVEGCRLALPGEFTRRALANGQMSLTEVEGLSDLIDAETEAQRKQAQRLLDGELGAKAVAWRADLVRAASLIEVTIDFADEDVPEDVSSEVLEILNELITQFRKEAAGSLVGDRVRSGFEVAILGPPNVGKSTLLNAIAGREAALTSDVAGTTRDVVEVRVIMGGIPVTFIDTAGVRESDNEIENLGIKRALVRGEEADLRIFLGDVEGFVGRADDIHAVPKGDLSGFSADSVSGLTGFGVAELLEKVQRCLAQRVSGVGVASNARHRNALSEAGCRLMEASKFVKLGSESYDLASVEIREALHAIDSLIGRVDVEDFLDEIFSSFCLGK